MGPNFWLQPPTKTSLARSRPRRGLPTYFTSTSAKAASGISSKTCLERRTSGCEGRSKVSHVAKHLKHIFDSKSRQQKLLLKNKTERDHHAENRRLQPKTIEYSPTVESRWPLVSEGHQDMFDAGTVRGKDLHQEIWLWVKASVYKGIIVLYIVLGGCLLLYCRIFESLHYHSFDPLSNTRRSS